MYLVLSALTSSPISLVAAPQTTRYHNLKAAQYESSPVRKSQISRAINLITYFSNITFFIIINMGQLLVLFYVIKIFIYIK